MIKTGWSKFWNEPSKYHNTHVFPSVSPEVAELLLERGVSALGIHMDEALRSLDLTTPQYAVLAQLELKPGAV